MALIDPLRGFPFLGDEKLSLPHDAVGPTDEFEPLGEERHFIECHGLARAEPSLPSPSNGEDHQEEAEDGQRESDRDSDSEELTR